MKLIKIFTLLLLLPLTAHAELAILNWNEYSTLASKGKKTVVGIKGQVKSLLQNQAMTAFMISFDKEQNIKIEGVNLDEKPAKYEFIDNALKIYFPDSRANGQMVSLKISYQEEYAQINEYLRQDVIYVPDFAVGADASVMINFSGYDLTTYNLNSVVNGNNLTYSAIVPQKGIREILKFTPQSRNWQVGVVATISTKKPLGEFSLNMPDYFRAGRQQVSFYREIFSTDPFLTDRIGNNVNYNFELKDTRFEAKAIASISTGSPYRRQVMRNMINYTKVSDQERKLLTPILQKIRANPAYGGLPLYVAIGKFVNDYIKYDPSYSGQMPSLEEILRDKTGVCTEFSKLYDALARLAGIPSIIINGGACGEYDQCQGHSWNMIFYGNNWIEIDPTWYLMSGIVSVSHVYTSENNQGRVEIKYRNDVGEVDLKMSLEMQDLDRKNDDQNKPAPSI